MTDRVDDDISLPWRILSIDGGGLKGAMSAAFLATIEEQTGARIVDNFDLIVGTSTGGIIAIGLGLGLRAAEILTFYKETGPAVFGQLSAVEEASRRRRLWNAVCAAGRSARRVFRSKYRSDGLRNALEERFKDRRLGESETRLVIPAWHSDRRVPYLFKTAHHPRLERDYKEKALDVAMATAAAPTYFPAHQLGNGVRLVDGGVWANNPAGVAAVEATGMLGWNMRHVRILSLGCTDEFFVANADAGFVDMGLTGGMALMFQGQSFSALSTAKLLLGGGTGALKRLCRVEVTVPIGFATMDDGRCIPKLAGLGCAEAREHLPRIREEFIIGNKRPFRPSHVLAEGRAG